MKRYIVAALFVLTFLVSGFQSAFSQVTADTARGNAVDDYGLPGELRNLDVKDYFIPSGKKPVGSILTVIGHVVVLHSDTNEAYFAQKGDRVFKNDLFFTLADSRCRIEFITADVITMGASTQIGVEELIDDQRLKKKKSVFNVLRGKAMFYAMRLFRYKTHSTSVNTPTAVVGVRGTKFGIEVSRIGDDLAAGPLYVADTSEEAFLYLARTGAGDSRGMQTTVRGYDGKLDTKSTVTDEKGSVGPGEKQVLDDTGARSVEDMDPEDAAAFEDSVKVPELGKGKTEKQPEEKTPAEPVKPADTTTEDQADAAAADQSDLNLEEGGSRPTTHQGYFSGMLICCEAYLEDVIVTQSSQDFDSDNIHGRGVYNLTNLVEAQGGSPVYDDPYLGKIALWGYDSGNLGTSRPITWTELGYNAYQEWGKWNVVGGPVPVGIYSEVTVEGGYYILGDHTPCEDVSGIQGDYEGHAYGTFFDNGVTSDMAGIFSCHVNGLNGTITDFDMAVGSTGGQQAVISGASGELGGCDLFIFDNSGTWVLNDGTNTYTDISHKEAHGALYGPNGEYVGGAWGMYYNSHIGASGIFQGSKQ